MLVVLMGTRERLGSESDSRVTVFPLLQSAYRLSWFHYSSCLFDGGHICAFAFLCWFSNILRGLIVLGLSVLMIALVSPSFGHRSGVVPCVLDCVSVLGG